MYDSDFSITTFPLTSSAPYSGVKASENTNLHTKFLLQFQKQQEDSAMLLASNKQRKDITKNRKTQQDRQNTQKRRAEKNKDQWTNQRCIQFETNHKQ
jgi:hypothetical protein